jgi:TetR/AcrR family transcriptional regulator, ethionamide resistance regulator
LTPCQNLDYGSVVATLTRRPEPSSAKRAEIEARLLAATEELLESGASYPELSVERIARGAGISRTAFYFYFRDKRELLMRLSEDVAELLYAEAEAWWSGEGEGRAELERALRQVVALYGEHGVLLRAVVEAAAVDDVIAGFWRALVGRFIAASRERVEAEVAAGRIAAMPAEEVASSLCWMTERACHQRVVGALDLGDEAFAAGLVRIWTGAIYGRL